MYMLKKISLIIGVVSFLLISCAQEKEPPPYSARITHYETFESFKPLLETPRGDSLLVFNFWATWCRPCVKEMPYFLKMDSAYATKKVQLVLVSIDDPKNIESKVYPFIEKRQIRQEVAVMTDHKQNDWIPQVEESWSGAIPATLAITPGGKVRAFKEASFTYEELTAWIDELLAMRDQ